MLPNLKVHIERNSDGLHKLEKVRGMIPEGKSESILFDDSRIKVTIFDLSREEIGRLKQLFDEMGIEYHDCAW